MTDESRVWFWHHRVDDDTPFLRHGRAHLTFRGYGTRNLHPQSSGSRRDLEFGTEWRFLVKKSGGFGWGWQFTWGTNGSETTPDVSVHFSRLGDLWLHAGGLLPYRWLERHTADGNVDYESRVFGFTADARGFRWDCWAPKHRWSRSDPWWMQQSFEWRRLFFGRDDCTTEVVDEGTCVVPMPEVNYPASWKKTRYERRYQRLFFGRIRDTLLGPRTHELVEVEPGKAIPVPGKGENSWDCGDDGIWALTAPGSVEEVIGKLVGDALRTRRRYGGEHMSVPEAAGG